MTGSPFGGAQLLQQDPRLLMAQQLMQKGGSSEQVFSPLEGIARMLTGAMGGYEAGQTRLQNMEALNQAMAALQDSGEPSKLKRFGNASAQMQAGAPYSPNPFMQAQIGLMTKPDTALPGRDRLVTYDAEGKPIVTLEQAPQSDIGALWKEMGQYKPGSAQFNSTLSKIQKLTMEGGYNVKPEGGMEAAPGGPADPGVVRKLKTAEEGGAGTGRMENAEPLAAAGARGAGTVDTVPVTINGREIHIPKSTWAQVAPQILEGMGIQIPGTGTPQPQRPQAGAPPATAPSQPAPAGAPAASPRIGVSPEEKVIGENLGKRYGEIGEEASAAEKVKQIIGVMRQAANGLRSGMAGEERARFATMLEPFIGYDAAQHFTGMDPSKADVFNTEATSLAFGMSRGLTSKPAQIEVQMAFKAKPSLQQTPEGRELVFRAIEQDAQRVLDQRDLRDAWKNGDQQRGIPAHGSLDGFDSWFNKAHPPAMYSSHVIPVDATQKPPPAKSRVMGAWYKTPSGVLEWNSQGWQAIDPSQLPPMLDAAPVGSGAQITR